MYLLATIQLVTFTAVGALMIYRGSDLITGWDGLMVGAGILTIVAGLAFVAQTIIHKIETDRVLNAQAARARAVRRFKGQ